MSVPSINTINATANSIDPNYCTYSFHNTIVFTQKRDTFSIKYLQLTNMWSDYSFYGSYDGYDDGSINRRSWAGESVRKIITIRMTVHGYSSMIERERERELMQVSRHPCLKHGGIDQPLYV